MVPTLQNVLRERKDDDNNCTPPPPTAPPQKRNTIFAFDIWPLGMLAFLVITTKQSYFPRSQHGNFEHIVHQLAALTQDKIDHDPRLMWVSINKQNANNGNNDDCMVDIDPLWGQWLCLVLFEDSCVGTSVHSSSIATSVLNTATRTKLIMHAKLQFQPSLVQQEKAAQEMQHAMVAVLVVVTCKEPLENMILRLRWALF